MKKNMGNTDRIIRTLIAVVLAVLFFTGTVTGILGYVLLGIGIIFLISSLFGSCPAYQLLGMSTCKTEKK